MFFFLSKLLDVLLSPLTWGLVLLAAAVPWRVTYARRWKRRRLLGGVGLALILLASAMPVPDTLLRDASVTGPLGSLALSLLRPGAGPIGLSPTF